ncbi:uroporphyrinogen-III synthase [Phaeodactylibacter sp.]|uniref:uroporphyrinogen-III synthase n=1 Tax=Phaeodactylibacter sp. TaxID=1940289 RepID=UPI0032EAE991
MERKGIRVSGQSLIRFEAVPFQSMPDVDWVFFYSPRAVHFFFQQLPENPVKSLRFGAVGRATARALETVGCTTTNFVGTGEPQSTASAFLKVAAGQRVLFPQARHSRQSVQQLLAGAIQGYSLVVYDNIPVKTVAPSPAEVLVFTSPLNARTYLKACDVLPGQRVIAIGQPTAEACRSAGASPYAAAAPDEAALAEAVLRCIEK